MLRGAFVAAFGLQAAFAFAVGGFVRVAFGDGGGGGGNVVTGALVAFAAVQVGVGVFVARLGVLATSRAARTLAATEDANEAAARLRTVRTGALAQTVASAVLLATPVWFAAFVVATGQGLAAFAALIALASLGYGIGVIACGRLAHAAVPRPRGDAG